MATGFWQACTAISAIIFSAAALATDNQLQNNGFWNNLEIGGRIVGDADQFDGIYICRYPSCPIEPIGSLRQDGASDTQKETELRRAQVYFKFPIGEDWSSKLQLALNQDDDNYIFKDAYLRYKGWDFADIRIGQSKQPFGLENITSSLNSSLIERSLAASAFALGRSPGINMADSKRTYSWSLGVYEVKQNRQIKTDGGKAYTARATFSPLSEDDQFHHYGISFSDRDLQGAKYEIESNGGVNSAFNFLDTRNIEVDSLEQTGIEAAWGRGRLAFQSEYQHQQINALDSADNARYQAYYGQMCYFLTPDHRPYKKGRFASVKPSSSKGAIELAIRYGALSTVGDSEPVRLTSTAYGVNYYLNKRVKLMLNRIKIDSTGVAKDQQQESGSATSLRVQFRF